MSAAPKGAVVMVTQDRQIDRRILLEADSLEAAGWSVRILAVPADEAARAGEDPRVVRIGGAQALPGREGMVLSLYRAARRRLPMDGPAMRLLKRTAWRFFVREDTFFLRLFEAAVREHPAQVYVAHDLPMLPVGAFARQVHGARLVYDSHELYAEQLFSEREKRAWRRLEQAHIGQCDAVMTVNPSIARELASRYGLPHVEVVYNAERRVAGLARERRFHQRLGLPDAARVLLFQGGLSAGRHIEALVRAMRQVRNPDVHLVVLGDGGLKPVLRELVAREGLQRRVHLQDAVPQAELVGWSAAADAGVIPYQATCLNNYYCTPNKLFEFIAAGVPVLASDLPEIRAIVEGHAMGQAADLSTEAGIAAAIDAFFGDAARLQRWREGAAAAGERLNWDVEGRKVAALFEGLR